MDKYEIIRKIEDFAPPETQEDWDCSGWIVKTQKRDIKKIMLCLTITQDVINQAKDCDLIISHHPLFFVPIEWKNKDMYCAHTNFDLAEGGTTDCMIEKIFPNVHSQKDGFLRYVNVEISVREFAEILTQISPNLRYANNKNIKILHRIAFCAGSGSEFINEAYQNGADAFVTGDVKFHTAVESPVVLFDVGHFESEIISLEKFEQIIESDVEVLYAQEQSPFITFD